MVYHELWSVFSILATHRSNPEISLETLDYTGKLRWERKAEGGIRTPDLLITNQLLYQLSYFGLWMPAGDILI